MFRRATELAPSNAADHSNLGLALKELFRFEEAEKALLRSLALEKSPNTLSTSGNLCFSQSRFSEASWHFEQSMQAGPPTAMLAKNLAEAEMTRNPRSASSRPLLALLAAHVGDANRAAFKMAQALQMDQQNVRVRRRAVQVPRDSPKSLASDLSHDPSLADLQKMRSFKSYQSGSLHTNKKQPQMAVHKITLPYDAAGPGRALMEPRHRFSVGEFRTGDDPIPVGPGTRTPAE